MDKLDLETTDLTDENIEKMGELFPQVITEAEDENGELRKAIDFDALRQELSHEMVEGINERYQFTWPGKQAAKLEARRPINKTLRPRREESVDFDTTENLYIEGDNLDALKLLRNTYAGKIKLIFIDPPYNTGHDFIYADDYSVSAGEYSELSGDYDDEGGRLVSNLTSNGRFHSDWCSMIYPRMMLAKDLLSHDGVIFISIDSGESANLAKICDEIFGKECFVTRIAWRSSDNSNNNALTFSEDFNDILVYSKLPGWQPHFLDDPEKRKHFKNPNNDPRGPWFDGNPVNNPGLRPNLQFNIETPSGKTINHPANGWRWSMETMKEKFSTGELRFSDDETRVIRRTYLSEMEGLPPSNLWMDLEKTGHTRRAKYELKKLFPDVPVTSLFSTPKPTDLISYILEIAADDDSLIMDFFAGSSSTAEAVMRRNYSKGSALKFILVQIPEPIDNAEWSNLCRMGEERIRRVGKIIKEEAGMLGQDLDIGFRVLKIDSSNFHDSYKSPDEYLQEELFKDIDNTSKERTPEDMLFEVLLKLRIPLSVVVNVTDISGKQVFDANEGQLLACFDTDVTTTAIEEIAKKKPVYAILRDASLKDDSAAANFEELFKTYSPDTVRKVI